MATAYLLQMFDKDGKPQITGDRTIKSDVRWLDLHSFSLGASQSGSGGHIGGGGGSGKVKLSDVNVTFDGAGVAAGEFFQATTNGRPFAKGMVDAFKDDVWVLRLTLTSPTVMSMSIGAAHGNESPEAMATLNSEKAVFEYFTVDKKGNVSRGSDWQVESNDGYDSNENAN